MEPIVFRDTPAILAMVLLTMLWSASVVGGIVSGGLRPASLVSLLVPAVAIWLVWKPAVVLMKDRVVIQRDFSRVEARYDEIRWVQETRRIGGARRWRLDLASGRHELPLPVMGVFALGMEDVVTGIQERAEVVGHPVQLRHRA